MGGRVCFGCGGARVRLRVGCGGAERNKPSCTVVHERKKKRSTSTAARRAGGCGAVQALRKEV